MLPVGFVVSVDLYVLAGDFFFFFWYGLPTASKPNPPSFLPFSRGDLISLLRASSEYKTKCAFICVCFDARRTLVSSRAQTIRARQTFHIPVLRFEKRGRKSQSSSYYSSLKENGEEWEVEGGGGEWMEGGRQKERAKEEG